MKKFTTSKPITIPAGVVIGLTKQQHSDRSHQLQPVTGIDIDDQSDWFDAYRAVAQLQFKAGETIYLDSEIPKTIVPNLSPVGGSGTPSDPVTPAGTATDEVGPGEADEIDSMTKGELIEALNALGITAKTSQKVDQLRQALRAASMSDTTED